MKAKALTVAMEGNARALRLAAILAAGFFFFVAQALVAAHAAKGPEHLKGHSVGACAVCLAGGAADDSSRNAPALTPPATRVGAEKTSIPAALLTEIAVRAASPRAPPSN
ncbi:MAG: hypothetical protein ACK4NP_09960 [Parvularculaceae bacterium]